MDKLSRFYLELSTDASKLARFNEGNTPQEIAKNRSKMLADAGVDANDEVIQLSQDQLSKLMVENLAQSDSQWNNIHKSANNNTDNNVSMFGR
ncbi:MAG: hypothetical protein OQJ89_12260 [Kangiellaceae bacterium]|nr:hypothetical protein [Kangiellaceae bacterium]MCW9017734.1 hypothetical protein [Kangiellaceae bacterium]